MSVWVSLCLCLSQVSSSSSFLSVPVVAAAVFSSASFAHYKRAGPTLRPLLLPLQSEEVARAAAAHRYAQEPHWPGQDAGGHHPVCREVRKLENKMCNYVNAEKKGLHFSPNVLFQSRHEKSVFSFCFLNIVNIIRQNRCTSHIETIQTTSQTIKMPFLPNILRQFYVIFYLLL